MHPQKKKKELWMKRERYHRQKEEKQQAKTGAAKQMPLSRTLFQMKKGSLKSTLQDVTLEIRLG